MKEGVIINIASASGTNGFAGMSAYCASKHALVGLTRALADELAPNIRVNAICPAGIKTDMTTLIDDKYLGDPDEVCKRVVYLIERRLTGKVI